MNYIGEMEILFAELPIFIFVVGAILTLFFKVISSSDRIFWDYEVEFPYQEGLGQGKIAFKSLERQEQSLKHVSDYIEFA